MNRISLLALWILGLAQDLAQSQDLFNRCVKARYEFGSYCYDHSGSGPGQTWNHAWVDCMSKGGRLVTISDDATQNYITHNIIWSQFGKKAEVWLGAIEHYSPWKWVNTGKSLLSLTGCYGTTGDEDLGPEDFTIDKMIPEKCVQKCLAFRFAIVQGSRCWCRETVSSVYPKVSDNDCSTPCSGDSQLSCGGESTIHVYHAQEKEGTYFNWARTSFTDGFNCVAYDKESRGWVNVTCSSQAGYGYACQDKGLLHVEVYDGSKTWFEAREMCARKGPGSDLAKIDSSALSEDIARKVMLRKNKRFWIGATNREWNWIPSKEPMVYSKWFGGYPQGEHRSCLMMKGRIGEVFSQAFFWENADCNATKPYICQYYKYKTTPSLTSTQSTTTNAKTSTVKEVETTSIGTPSDSSDISTIVMTEIALESEPTKIVDAPIGDTGRQEDKGEPFSLTLILVVTVISLIVIAIVVVIVYFVRRKRSPTPDAKSSQENSVHFSQNPLYKSSDDAVDTDENIAVNIYGTQDDLASSMYDNPAQTAPIKTEPPLAIQQPGPERGRYSVESSDLPSNYVGMTMKGSRSPSNDTLRSDDVIYLTDDTPDLYVSADQADGVEGISNPIYDFPSNVR